MNFQEYKIIAEISNKGLEEKVKEQRGEKRPK